jgi:hypothetical protein
MKRVVIKLKDGTHINTEAEFIERDEEFITAFHVSGIAAIVRTELVLSAHISEAKQ